jgi:cell wall-associated NlpC family hydrolase
MKWLLTIAMTLFLIGCVSPSSDAEQLANDGTTGSLETRILVGLAEEETNFSLAKTVAQAQAELEDNEVAIRKVVDRLLNRVGKTPYVFSGSTPYGWDCSGMVMWAYGELGVNLEHSATEQANSGQRVSVPKVGDIVVFGWEGRKGYFHSAIYIGNGKVVNANRGFGGTYIQKTSEFNTERIVYVRHIETS